MKYDIFISYKSEYISIVKALSHTLENEGVRCWYAPRDLDNNRAGSDYDDAICSAINNSRAVILVLSNEALCSEWVKIEIGHAQIKKKLIIPYVINEISSIHEDNGLLMRLRNKHWIDAYPNPERKFSTLLQNVKIVLNSVLETEENSEKEKFVINDSYSDDITSLFDYEEGVALYEAKEYIDAIYAFMAAAERGHKESKFLLCKIFYNLNKIPFERVPEDIWSGFNRIAMLGHGYANFVMHTKYYK